MNPFNTLYSTPSTLSLSFISLPQKRENQDRLGRCTQLTLWPVLRQMHRGSRYCPDQWFRKPCKWIQSTWLVHFKVPLYASLVLKERSSEAAEHWINWNKWHIATDRLSSAVIQQNELYIPRLLTIRMAFHLQRDLITKLFHSMESLSCWSVRISNIMLD